MNILFTYTTNNQKQISICRSLSHILKNGGNSLVLYTMDKKTNELFPNFKQYVNNNIEDFDIIVVYTKKALQNIKQIAKYKHKAVIYIMDSAEIEHEYPDITLIDKIVILGNTEQVPILMLRKDLLHTLPLLPPIKDTATQKHKIKKDNISILIDVSKFNMQYSKMYWIIPLCNVLIRTKISILYEETPLLPLFNTNVKLIDKKGINVDNIIKKHDIIIANGDTIYNAISANKACIVVGEQGYGGLVSASNMQLLSTNNFQGRIGGYIGEYIPEKLLQDDLQTITTFDEKELNEFLEQNKIEFTKLYDNYTKKWNRLLNATFERKAILNSNLSKCILKLSSDLVLVPFTNDKYVLTYSATRQVHSNFGKAEADIITLFNKPQSVKKAMEKSGYSKDKEMFLEFIEMLISEKILMLDEDK